MYNNHSVLDKSPPPDKKKHKTLLDFRMVLNKIYCECEITIQQVFRQITTVLIIKKGSLRHILAGQIIMKKHLHAIEQGEIQYKKRSTHQHTKYSSY